MQSAAENVFAITELLELILLEIYASEHTCNASHRSSFVERDYIVRISRFKHPANRLFVLQRVNKTFVSTILGSVKLRYLVGLEYSKQRWTCDISQLLSPQHSEFMDLLNLCTETAHGLSNGAVFIKADLIMNGPNTWSPSLSSGCTPSWYKIRLVKDGNTPAKLTMKMRYHDTRRIFGDLCYIKCYQFEPGSGTLGDIVTMFETVEARKLGRHWLAAACQDLVYVFIGVVGITIFAVLYYGTIFMFARWSSRRDAGTANVCSRPE